MTDPLIPDLREKLEKAKVRLPWRVDKQLVKGADPEALGNRGNSIWQEHPQGPTPVMALGFVRPEGGMGDWVPACLAEQDDAELIVAAVNALPTLLDRLSALLEPDEPSEEIVRVERFINLMWPSLPLHLRRNMQSEREQIDRDLAALRAPRIPPSKIEVGEAPTSAAFRAIYGDGVDPFQHPEGWEFASCVAGAVVAALHPTAVQSDEPTDAMVEAAIEAAAKMAEGTMDKWDEEGDPGAFEVAEFIASGIRNIDRAALKAGPLVEEANTGEAGS